MFIDVLGIELTQVKSFDGGLTKTSTYQSFKMQHFI